MIYYVTGVLGAGKSLYATRKMAQTLLSGRVAAGNIRLREEWPEIVLKHSPLWWSAGKRGRHAMMRELMTRYHYTDDIEELLWVGVHGYGEGRGRKFFDELHRNMNNRRWKEEEQQAYLDKMTMARHEGWEYYVLSQHKDNTDVAVRRIAAFEIKVLNWRQVIRLLGFQVLPFNLFLAVTRTMNLDSAATGKNGEEGIIVGRELYKVGWYGRLYDTHAHFGEMELENDPRIVWLPKEPGSLSVVVGSGAAVGAPTVKNEARRVYKGKSQI